MVKLANFKEDSKGRNLLVYDYVVVGKNEARKLEVQLDARDSAAKGAAGLVPDANTSLRLVDRKTHYPDAEGKAQARYEHGAFYSNKQFDKIKEAAGAKHQEIKLENGNTVNVYGIKADLVQTKENFLGEDLKKFEGKVLAINTAKEMGPSDFTVGPKVYENQYKNTMKIKEASKAAYEELKANAPEVPTQEAEAEVQDKSVDMDAPEL